MSSPSQITNGQPQWNQVVTADGLRRMRADGTGGQFGSDGPEAVRREKQHIMLKEVFGGRLFISEVVDPTQILDFGFKTGLWSMEVLEQFPNATIYGVEEDTVLFKRAIERDYGRRLLRRHLRRGQDYLEGHFKYVKVEHLPQDFPFADQQFDFSYAQFPDVFCSDEAWVRLLRELTRGTKPDGWVEILYSGHFWTVEPSPLISTMLQVQIEVCKELKIAPTGEPKMDEYLQAAGITIFHRRTHLIGENARERQMVLRDIQAIIKGSEPVVIGENLMPKEDFYAFLAQFVEEGHKKGFRIPFCSIYFQPKDQM